MKEYVSVKALSLCLRSGCEIRLPNLSATTATRLDGDPDVLSWFASMPDVRTA